MALIDEMDSSSGLKMNLNYICWLIAVCAIDGYQDDSVEFDNDAMDAFYTVDFIKTTLAAEDKKKIFYEIKHFLVAYKILCQPKIKLQNSIDVEFWYPDHEINDPLEKWYWYYLPVNLDCHPMCLPKLNDTQGARAKILKYKAKNSSPLKN